MDYIWHVLDYFKEFADWLWNGMKQLLLLGLQTLLDASASLIEKLPALPQAGDLASVMGALPSGVWWFLWPMHLSTGLVMIGIAYAIRFLIRRMPIVG